MRLALLQVDPGTIRTAKLCTGQLSTHSRVDRNQDLRAVLRRGGQLLLAVEDPRLVDVVPVEQQSRLVQDDAFSVELELDVVALVDDAVPGRPTEAF